MGITPPGHQDEVGTKRSDYRVHFSHGGAPFHREDRWHGGIAKPEECPGLVPDTEMTERVGGFLFPARREALSRPLMGAGMRCPAIGYENDVKTSTLPGESVYQAATAERLIIRMRGDNEDLSCG